MKRAFAILFMFTLLLQAIPVLHFFSEGNFYVYVDEDKPEETKLKKKEVKEYISATSVLSFTVSSLNGVPEISILALPAPYLESFTPPPNITC